jgi:hypothetical protein
MVMFDVTRQAPEDEEKNGSEHDRF